MKPLKVRNEGLWREMGIRARNVTRKLKAANSPSLIFFSGASQTPDEQFPALGVPSRETVAQIMEDVAEGPKTKIRYLIPANTKSAVLVAAMLGVNALKGPTE